ncbi:MAG: hypothetical protein ACR2MQ_03900 [Gemmatimonadaceae bacterium]
MPLYNTATAAAALDVSPKWLDNLLSHNKIDGVLSKRQGISRRLSRSAVELVAIVRDLSSDLGLSTAAALLVAEHLLQAPDRSYAVSPSVTLSLDIIRLNREIEGRLAHAVEMAPHPSRGRPVKRD